MKVSLLMHPADKIEVGVRAFGLKPTVVITMDVNEDNSVLIEAATYGFEQTAEDMRMLVLCLEMLTDTLKEGGVAGLEAALAKQDKET